MRENIVFVVSTETKQFMHQWYSKGAPMLGLAAENGFFWRWISRNSDGNDWKTLIELDDFEWMKKVRLIMNAYKDKTDGTFIEEKESSISWIFKNTDPEYGQM
jgi:trehalose 6-phosphate synthase/phosphatase